MILGISGKISSGKDEVGKIIRYLTLPGNREFNLRQYLELGKNTEEYLSQSNWEVKKFADKLKDIVCMLLGCTREQLEDRNFKEAELGEEWYKYFVNGCGTCKDSYFSSYKDALNYRDNNVAKYTRTELPKLIKLTPRLLLQLLGTDCGRDIIHPNIWINSLMADYNSGMKNPPHKDFKTNWIVTDTRFVNEALAIDDKDGLLIRVNRGDGNTGDHPSETALDDFAEWDYVIDNNGTIEDLVKTVRGILFNEKII